MVDRIRIRIVDVLRSYALKDQELGYTQGLSFPATAICLQNNGPEADEQFGALMERFRALWLPGFPLLVEGAPLLEALLGEHDPEILSHFARIGLDLQQMVLPQAWLTLFARWLPLQSILEIFPFLTGEGLPGILTVTLMLILFHQRSLLGCQDMEEALAFLGALPDAAPPEGLLDMCIAALPVLRARIQCMAR